MSRITRGVARLKRKRKIMHAAKGARGGRSKLYKSAKETVEKGLTYAYRDRRLRKRDFRRLWIARINAAARSNEITYSRMMCGLKNAGVEINRKVMADMAVHDPVAFGELAEIAKKSL
jgi:large subunit ribosomal protein L20